jgi:hypothetical protein
MDSIYKIHSVQAETLSSTQNLLDFDIPAGQVFDLSKSYVSINARASGTSANANQSTAVFPVAGEFNTASGAAPQQTNYVKANALVKNARFTSAVKGKIEECRDVNLLRSFINNVYEPQSVFFGNEYHNMMPMRTYEAYGSTTPLIDCSSEEGGDLARYIDKSVKIPLSDILNVGVVKQFDTRRLGKCRLNLELAMNKFTATIENYDDAYFTTTNNGTLLNITNNTGGNVELTSAVLARGGGTAAKLYDEDYQEHIPFYIGMPVKTNGGQINGGALATQNVTITNIAYDNTTGQITLTFSASLGQITNTNSSDDIKIEPLVDADMNSRSVDLSQAELVLYSLGSSNMSNVPQQINYTTYSLERDNGNNSGAFKRQYEMEPNAINALVLMRATGESTLSNVIPTGYRVAINNELTTDRSVVDYNPIYFNQLNKYSLNQGRQVANVIGKEYLREPVAANTDRGTLQAMGYVVEPLPITTNMKLVEFEIESAGLNDFSVYKEVLASI